MRFKIRKRKEQYVTSWQPRYFAYPKRTSVLFAFVQLSLLITKGDIKVFRLWKKQ